MHIPYPIIEINELTQLITNHLPLDSPESLASPSSFLTCVFSRREQSGTGPDDVRPGCVGSTLVHTYQSWKIVSV